MPKIVDHDKQRAFLLEQCFKMFARDGYRAVTMRKIAAAAGVSTGTLYHYFSTKRDILSQMFEWVTQRDVARVVGAVDTDADMATRVAAITDYVVEHGHELQDLLLLAIEVLRAEPDESSKEDVRAAIRRYRSGVFDTLGIADPKLGALITSLVLGMITQDLLDDQSDIDGQLQSLLPMLTMIQHLAG